MLYIIAITNYKYSTMSLYTLYTLDIHTMSEQARECARMNKACEMFTCIVYDFFFGFFFAFFLSLQYYNLVQLHIMAIIVGFSTMNKYWQLVYFLFVSVLSRPAIFTSALSLGSICFGFFWIAFKSLSAAMNSNHKMFTVRPIYPIHMEFN